MSKTNLEGDIVYSTPKEEREKKERKPKKNFDNEKKRERKPREEKEEKPAVQYDSDGFEIISEKVKTTKKRREYDGERKWNKKEENDSERPQTAVRKNSNANEKVQKPKAIVQEKVEMQVVSLFYFNIFLDRC